MTNTFHSPSAATCAKSDLSDLLKHLMKDRRSVCPSMCSPSSGSSAMARSSRSDANAVEIAKRRKELQRARQQAFTLKQLEQPPGTGSEKALADRRHHDCAGVD